jgi:hypothetical protein
MLTPSDKMKWENRSIHSKIIIDDAKKKKKAVKKRS